MLEIYQHANKYIPEGTEVITVHGTLHQVREHADLRVEEGWSVLQAGITTTGYSATLTRTIKPFSELPLPTVTTHIPITFVAKQ